MLPCLLFIALPVLAAEPPELAVSRRLEEKTQRALDGLLGPGRASVAVEVRGRRATRRELSEITRRTKEKIEPPVPKPRLVELPGYEPQGPQLPEEPARHIENRLVEETVTEPPFVIESVKGALVLDRGLDEDSSARATMLAGELLGMDPLRGDELTVSRSARPDPPDPAPAREAEERRRGLYFAGAAGTLLLCSIILGSSLPRAARALAGKLAPAAPAAPPAPAPRSPRPDRRIVPLPDLDRARSGGLDAPGGAA